jgi:hypothetical protein
MKNFYTWKALAVLSLFYFFAHSTLFGQVSLTASAGTLTGTFTTVSDAFAAINAGTHQGTIVISINGNTTEPAAPNALLASGQGTSLFTSLTIKPTVVATISGATSPGSGVLNFNGADNIVIDGSIAPAGTSRDLTISNSSFNRRGWLESSFLLSQRRGPRNLIERGRCMIRMLMVK